MRRALLAVLLLAAPALAQPAGPLATLVIDVQPDASERMTLTFEGLRRLTRYENLCLPERAEETRVYDELGDLQHEAREDNGRRTITFVARGTTVHIDMTRGAPDDEDHPLLTADANFCVPSQSRVVVKVNVPERHTLFFLSGASTLSARAGSVESSGPSHVFYSYEAPADARRPLALVVAEPFRIFVDASLAPRAQEVAQLAADPFRAALAEAGLSAPFDAFRVVYKAETPLAWEAGHYGGRGYVEIKETTLAPDPTQGYPVSGARVLVHEAFHAASFPYGRGSVEDTLAWWLEGTAKRAERHVDAAMPNATRHCERSVAEVRCWDFDDRIRRADLETAYAPGFTFDTRWEPALPQDDATREFYYAYSEFVVSAWIARHGEAEYQRVWDAVSAALDEGEGCPCREGWLVTLLDDPSLFRPWEDVKAASPSEFDALVKPYVRDEEGLQRELDRQARPWSGLGIPVPWWGALAALGGAAAIGRRRGR